MLGVTGLEGFEGGFAAGYRAALSGGLNPHSRYGPYHTNSSNGTPQAQHSTAQHGMGAAATGWVGTHPVAGVCRRIHDSAGTARAHLPADLPAAARPSSTLTRGTLVPLNLGRLDRARRNLEYSAGRGCVSLYWMRHRDPHACCVSSAGTPQRVPAPLDHCTDRTAQAGTAATGWVGMRRRHGPCLAIQDWAGTRQVPAAKALPALRHRWTRIRVLTSLVLPSPAEYRNLLSTTRPPACGRQRWHG